MTTRPRLAALTLMTLLAACGDTGGLGAREEGSPFAPPLDTRGEAVDGLIVGHRLMDAGQYELALEAFNRAAYDKGVTSEILVALGSANLGLGRLNQSEKLLRRAVKDEPDWPEAWNNLGVVLMETGRTAEAAEIFRKAYALDNGKSDSIRDNLRLALAKLENSVYGEDQGNDFKLVRRGSGDYLITRRGG